MNAERRKHFTPVEPLPFVPVTDNCKWVQRDGFAEAYCIAMGWTKLHEEGDGALYQAPAGFMDEQAARQLS